MSRHEFLEFMESMRSAMLEDYVRIRARSHEDPGTAGDQTEELWAEFLRDWLPATYPVVTKGRILAEDRTASPQVDILVLEPSYPRRLRNQKYYFAGGVVAAFECKLTLRGRDLAPFLRTAQAVKTLVKPRTGTVLDEISNPPIFGLLAHSHSLGSKTPQWRLLNLISQTEAKVFREGVPPRELPDLICVADTAVCVLNIDIGIGPHCEAECKKALHDCGFKEGLVGGYLTSDQEVPNGYDLDHRGVILGTLVFALTERLAFNDPSLRRFAEYLSGTDIWTGVSRITCWSKDVLSADVIAKLRRDGYEEDPWSKWRNSYF